MISSNEHYNIGSNRLCSGYHDKDSLSRFSTGAPGNLEFIRLRQERGAARNDGLTDEHSFQLST